jgi:hypothetical protein
MSFSLRKQWDNRKHPVRLDPKTGRSWTRRIQWLEDAEDRVKLKLQDGESYREVIAVGGMAQTIWDRFKTGQSIDDSVSILGNDPPKFLRSRKS